SAEFSRKNLQVLLETVCAFLEKAYTHCARSGRAHAEAGIGQQLQRQLYDFLLAWLKKVEAEQNAAELRAAILRWAIYGGAKQWTEGKRQESARDFVRQALPMIAASLDLRA